MRSHVNYMASKGYFALSFDPPGTWESPGDITLYTMTNYLKAINELIDHFDNKPTFVMGHSRGASMAILSGLRNQYIFSFTSVFSSFTKGGYKDNSGSSKWKKQGYILEKRDLPPGGGPKTKEFKLPYSFFKDQLQYDFTKELSTSKKPKLFFLGRKDILATPEVIKGLYAITSEPKQLYELNSDHDYRLKKDIVNEVNTAVGTFLAK